jgi:hypothetical protein
LFHTSPRLASKLPPKGHIACIEPREGTSIGLVARCETQPRGCYLGAPELASRLWLELIS